MNFKNFVWKLVHGTFKIEELILITLLDKNSYEIFWFMTFCSKLWHKTLCIMFDVDGCIRDDDGSKYLVLFGLEKYNTNLG